MSTIRNRINYSHGNTTLNMYKCYKQLYKIEKQLTIQSFVFKNEISLWTALRIYQGALLSNYSPNWTQFH